MLKVLQNPTTNLYHRFRNLVLSGDFAWHYGMSTDTKEENPPGHMHMEFYGHTFVTRPEATYYSESTSPFINESLQVLREIIDYNKLFESYIFTRAAANCTFPNEGAQLSHPHVDHNFPHFNLIVYLTDTGGETFVEDEIHNPKIHDVILFRGKHYMKRPTRDRRVILVATILPTDDNGLESIGLQSNHDKISAANGN